MRFGDASVLTLAWSVLKLAMPIGFQAGILGPNPNYELREDSWPEVREEGTLEIRDAP